MPRQGTVLWGVVSLLMGGVLVLPLEAATTYYVSFTGNDANPGNSEQQAWKSVSKVNEGTYRSGDQILFEGGKSFRGTLLFHAGNLQGTIQSPVTVSSYGKGQATLNGDPASGGIFTSGAAGIVIRNINIMGNAPNGSGSGISFIQETANTVSGIQITDVEISGWNHGVWMGTGEIPSKIRNVRIERASVHDNAIGIGGYGHLTIPAANSSDDYALGNVYIGHCQLFRNTGFGVRDSGVAVVIMNAQNVVLEHNVIHDNGGDHLGPGDYANGPSAITIYDGHKVTIQHNEIYHQRVDPDGLTDNSGIDMWATDSLVQYNYVHDNEGWGMTLGAGNPKDPNDPYKWPSQRNTIRYNVFENNARRLPDSKDTPELRGAQLLMFGPINDFWIYHNTFYSRNPGPPRKAPRSESTSRGPEHTGSPDIQGMVWIMSAPPGGRGLRFSNNLFIGEDKVYFVELLSDAQVSFLNNAYLGGSPRGVVKWRDVSYDSIKAWSEATGQEKRQEVFVGKTGNTDIHVQAARQGKRAASYRLKSGSSLIDAGLDLKAAFDLDVGKLDFFGNPVPAEKGFDIGAHEFSPGS